MSWSGWAALVLVAALLVLALSFFRQRTAQVGASAGGRPSLDFALSKAEFFA